MLSEHFICTKYNELFMPTFKNNCLILANMLIIKEKKYRRYIKRDFKILSLWLYGKNLPQLFAIFPYSQLPMDKNKYKQDMPGR